MCVLAVSHLDNVASPLFPAMCAGVLDCCVFVIVRHDVRRASVEPCTRVSEYGYRVRVGIYTYQCMHACLVLMSMCGHAGVCLF